MNPKLQTRFAVLTLTASLCAVAFNTSAQSQTAFTYQGQLRAAGTNVNGIHQALFVLYDAPSNGNQIGIANTNSIAVSNGLFTAALDFGTGAFTGAARWLEVRVDQQTLQPRSPVSPAPYALYAYSSPIQTNGSTSVGTNITFGGGGTSWDLGIDGAGQFVITYGDPLTNAIWKTNGSVEVRSNIVALAGDLVANNGGVQLNGPLGQIKFPDGSVQTNAATPVPHGIRTFDSNGSFVVPFGITRVLAEMWGGGGAGGAGLVRTQVDCSSGPCVTNTILMCGGGGGSGAYGQQVFDVTPGTSYSVVVGTGGTAGHDGTGSSFLSMSAGGGKKGQDATTNTNGAGGAGGTVSGSAVPADGEHGGDSSPQFGGFGGQAFRGSHGGFGAPLPHRQGQLGGGGGGAAGNSTPGDGGEGLVLIYY